MSEITTSATPDDLFKPLKTWPRLLRYLVEELERDRIPRTTAIRIVRQAWIRTTQPQEVRNHG
jgi:hypothetical protein